jgi:ATP-dependent DNA helicase PIF1
VFRQKDPDFIKLLNEVRVGDLSGETIRALCKRQKPITYEDGIKAVSLFPKKVRIKSENDKNLSKLGSPSQHYYAMDTSGRENQEPYELFYPDPIRLCTFLNSVSSMPQFLILL